MKKEFSSHNEILEISEKSKKEIQAQLAFEIQLKENKHKQLLKSIMLTHKYVITFFCTCINLEFRNYFIINLLAILVLKLHFSMLCSILTAFVYCTSFSQILKHPFSHRLFYPVLSINSFNIIQYTLLQHNTFRLEAQLRNISSKSFDAFNDKNTVEYEAINPEEFTSIFLDKNEGIFLLLKIQKETKHF